ncbi:MAG: GNAT family N-acetyltransferase [Candidatus Marinimicrobia bacterium]|nr:GNAT family N-acetyltransferase [Candidatus Neomarinimicrobiota bacterium]MCF7850591.1 GNAT family N-acetyltransferase [Candidatus Neomarinimicrobiota bacterium]MCF7903675.1 GNAT family N-acetyltransferase [Candidatus Neomarinimicrobiota bacterium]
MNDSIKVRIISDENDMQNALAIRQAVFVVEQKVDPTIEYDEFEAVATHVLATLDGHSVGTARWRETDSGYKLERFAVPTAFRGRGVGAALLRFILDQIDDNSHVYLNSQMVAIGFYERFGFKAVGEIFYEADIPHKKMVL